MRKLSLHRDHRVVAVYDDSDAAVFPLPAGATLAQLCEALAARAPRRGMLPVRVEVNVGR